jgi:hypothetical protein
MNIYLAVSEQFLEGTRMPSNDQGDSIDMPLIDFCYRQVEVELASNFANGQDRFTGTNVQSLIEKLAAYGCNGSELLARLIAARFDERLSRYADILLDELLECDADLVFEINNFTYYCYVSYTLNVSPLRCASLDGYMQSMINTGYGPSHGQGFGVYCTRIAAGS